MSDKYVCTSDDGGDDADNGDTWTTAYESLAMACANVGNGDTIYIQSGIYLEVLEDIKVASGNSSFYIVPMNAYSHAAGDAANVVIAASTDGNRSTSVQQMLGWYSMLQVQSTSMYRHKIDDYAYPTGTVIHLIDLMFKASIAVTISDVQFVHLRPDGNGNYIAVDRTDWQRVPTLPDYTSYYWRYGFYCGFNLQSGDKICFSERYVSGTGNVGMLITTNKDASIHLYSYNYPSGELPETTAISSWSEVASSDGYGVVKRLRYVS